MYPMVTVRPTVPPGVGRSEPLKDDLDADRSIVLDSPAAFVAVVDVEFSTDASRNVRPISRHLALGVDTHATQTREQETVPDRP